MNTSFVEVKLSFRNKMYPGLSLPHAQFSPSRIDAIAMVLVKTPTGGGFEDCIASVTVANKSMLNLVWWFYWVVCVWGWDYLRWLTRRGVVENGEGERKFRPILYRCFEVLWNRLLGSSLGIEKLTGPSLQRSRSWECCAHFSACYYFA